MSGTSTLCKALVGGALAALAPNTAAASVGWKPDHNVEIIIPTAAGSGSDTTGRFIQSLLQDKKLIDVPAVVVNKPGGGGAIGLAYLNQHAGSGRHFLVTSPSLLTNHITGKTAITYRDLTPLAFIGTEYVAFSVRADSPLRTGADLVGRLKQDTSSVSFGMAAALGNHNHIAIGQVARAAGADLKKLKIVVFSGSGQVVTNLLGAHVDVIASPGSAVVEHARSGKVRVVAISSRQRLLGRLADVPTWTEQGIPAVSGNTRIVVGPEGMSDVQVRYWDSVFASLTQQDEWKKETEKRMFENTYLTAAQTRSALDALYSELSVVLRELGLAK